MPHGERFNTITHLVGASFALVGGAALVASATAAGRIDRIVSVSVYSLTLFLLFLASTLYHGVPGRAKKLLRKLDHQAIYLLIAGTYTPFVLIKHKGSSDWWLLGMVWFLAAVGIVLDALPQRRARVIPVILCLVMGWLCVFVPDTFIATLSPESLWLLIAGGLLYSSGVVFYVLSHWHPYCHGIWHLFVLAGSASHFFAIRLL